MPTVNMAIFEKLGTGLPGAVTHPIRALCTEVSPGMEPTFLEVRPESDARPAECFLNVIRKVERDGGEIAYGWAIWEWPRVYVEAEHHAVWTDGTSMVDVTPHVPERGHVLFLPDPGRTYDFEGKKRVLNVRRSLGRFASAQAFIDASDRADRYIECNSTGSISNVDNAVLAALRREWLQARARILIDLAKDTGRNEPCFCRSGRKFKRCCSPLIDLNV